ncbi:hypothetical protein B2G71_21165 [Novosphingobium sp. PC22D]|nr:hypothetical protein B2G71_21165 [Novosphingobium sp. PC22D]
MFPAVVALWFGALFGLGSLAIRPALLEQAVLATGIDAVIPMATPPLGMTARILLALAMTGLGGVIGGLLAHRLFRPASPQRERRRGAMPATEEIYEAELAQDPEAAPASPGRRRALALKEDVTPHQNFGDTAPVPGEGPRILDVSEFELESFDEDAHYDDAPEDEPDHDAAPAFLADEALSAGEEDEAFNLGAYRHAPEDEALALTPASGPFPSEPRRVATPADAQVFHEPSTEFALSQRAESDDEAAAPAIRAAAGPHEATDARQMFDADPLSALRNGAGPSSDANAEDDSRPAPETAPTPTSTLSNRLFEAYSRKITARTEQFSRAPDAPSPFESPAASPAPEPGARPLARLGLKRWEEPLAEDEDKTECDGAFDLEEPNEPLFAEAAPAPDTVSSDEADEAAAAAMAANDTEPQVASRLSLGAAAASGSNERIANAELDSLSPLELLERLAISMARRRAEREAARESTNEPSSAPEVTASAPPPEAQTFEPIEQAASPEPTQPAAQAEPTEPDAQPETVEAREDRREFAPLSPLGGNKAIPAALRPVSFDDDDDSDALPGYVPPRHIGFAPRDAGAATAATADETASENDDEVLEAGYSSLLDLSRPPSRQQFVRIEEPESNGEIQPVVVFPGEEPQTKARPRGAAAETSPPKDDFAAPPAAPARGDPDDTERALRAALATLQRMSSVG